MRQEFTVFFGHLADFPVEPEDFLQELVDFSVRHTLVEASWNFPSDKR